MLALVAIPFLNLYDWDSEGSLMAMFSANFAFFYLIY